jgi:hypothetical protein
MSVLDARKQRGSAGRRRHGVAGSGSRDAIGYAMAALNRISRSPALDRFGLRKPTERAVFEATRTGFRTLGALNRQFARSGSRTAEPARTRPAQRADRFDLTPTEDEQMLVEVARELAAEVLRPAAADADEAAQPEPEVIAQATEVGLATLGVPEELGGISAERSATAGVLVTEALATGDMGSDRRVPRAGGRGHGTVPVGQ